MNPGVTLNGNGAEPPDLSDTDALTSVGLDELVAECVMDKLDEYRRLDPFLDRVIAKVNSWRAEHPNTPFVLPEELMHDNVQSATGARGSEAAPRRAFHHRYEDDLFVDIKTKVLVSCFDNASREGALYEIDFGANSLREVFLCDGRGLAKTEDGFVLLSKNIGVYKLDSKFQIKSFHPLQDLDLHGVAICQDGLAYIVETRRNRIGIYDLDAFDRKDEIVISSDFTDRNHVNDLCFHDGKLLVSMFSTSEVARRNFECEIYDGAIVEYDIASKSPIRTVKSGLRMPHSVRMFNDALHYCESFSLNVVRGGDTMAQFAGYTRGLDYDGRYYFVGQSRLRHVNKHKEVTLSGDAGIHVIAPNSPISRFIQLPVSDIYGIMVVGHENTDLQGENYE